MQCFSLLSSAFTLTEHFIRNTTVLLGSPPPLCCSVLPFMDFTRCLTRSFEILLHVDLIAIFFGFVSCTFILGISHSTASLFSFSIGLRSGDWGGHWSSLNSCSIPGTQWTTCKFTPWRVIGDTASVGCSQTSCSKKLEVMKLETQWLNFGSVLLSSFHNRQRIRWKRICLGELLLLQLVILTSSAIWHMKRPWMKSPQFGTTLTLVRDADNISTTSIVKSWHHFPSFFVSSLPPRCLYWKGFWIPQSQRIPGVQLPAAEPRGRDLCAEARLCHSQQALIDADRSQSESDAPQCLWPGRMPIRTWWVTSVFAARTDKQARQQ